jgi:hypothetical protein
MAAKTRSEQLFEQALRQHGVTTWQYEPKKADTARRADYSICYQGREVVFELKEMLPGAGDYLGNRISGPAAQIRQKIEEALDQLAGYEAAVCAVVLFNAGRPFELSAANVCRAMYGELGWGVPFAGIREPSPAATLLSAAIVIEEASGRGEANRPGSDSTVARFIVCENPLARSHFPRTLLSGTEDERYALIGAYWRQLPKPF